MSNTWNSDAWKCNLSQLITVFSLICWCLVLEIVVCHSVWQVFRQKRQVALSPSTVDLLIMHSHWNDLRLMHYDIYATPNMSRVRDFCDLSENVTSRSNVFTCFNVCTSSQRRWAGNWEGFGCTEWHCRELYRFFWSHWRWWRAIDKFWKKKMLCKSIIDMEKC